MRKTVLEYMSTLLTIHTLFPGFKDSFDCKGSPTLQQNGGVGTHSLQGFFENTARDNRMAHPLCD